MKLTLKRDMLVKNISENDLKYALIDAQNAKLLVELMEHSKPKNLKYLQHEIFRNANPNLKMRMLAIIAEESTGLNINYHATDINRQLDHTLNYSKRFKNNNSVELEVEQNSFESLCDAVLTTGDPTFIIDFAKNYKVNDQKFLASLQDKKIYVKAYKINVLDLDEYHKDAMQNM